MTHTFNTWHFWQGTSFLASEETQKRLFSFRSIDDCVNYLFLSGEKAAARSLQQAKRAYEAKTRHGSEGVKTRHGAR
jgi:hypothetical protein